MAIFLWYIYCSAFKTLGKRTALLTPAQESIVTFAFPDFPRFVVINKTPAPAREP